MLYLLAYTISITDAITGYGIRATVKINDIIHKTTENGFLTLNLKEGKYNIEVQAKGYRGLKTTLKVDKTTPEYINFMLMPLEIPQPPKQKKGYAIWYGWVVDERTHSPLENVRVEVHTPYGKYGAKTDNKGYYYIEFPIKGSNGEKPLEGKVIFSKDGYTTFEKTGIFILEGVQRLNAQLPPGKGKVIKKKEHGINTEKQSGDYKKTLYPFR